MKKTPGVLPPTERGLERILHEMAEANDIQRDEHGHVRRSCTHIEPTACAHVHTFTVRLEAGLI